MNTTTHVMKQYPFLDLALANAPYIDELKQAACQVVESGRYLHGELTAQLESKIAEVCHTKHCVAVSNGLDALRLTLRAYKEMGALTDGDAVIVPANTYVATVLAVSDNGLQPCLCDVRPDTMNLDSQQMLRLMSPKVKAVMPVHLYGTPCCDATLTDTARLHGLKVIEDNAQAIGAQADCAGLNGTTATGGLGHAGALSFYPTKNLGALGDGGAVTTNDEQLAATVRALANYGADRRYHNIYRGLNCRIDEIQAVFLLVKLNHLQAENDRRNAVARAYSESISNQLVTTPTIFTGMRQVWHQYVVRVKSRDKFRQYLKEHPCLRGSEPAHCLPHQPTVGQRDSHDNQRIPGLTTTLSL